VEAELNRQMHFSRRSEKPRVQSLHAPWVRLTFWGLVATAVIVLGILFQATSLPARPGKKTPEPLPAPVKAYGSKTAPIAMEVFSDYECPACRALYEQTLRPMINDYVAAGKVYLVHRDFPLSGHKYSPQATRWANAAARIGQFGNVEAALYDNQAAWSADGNFEKFISGAMPPADFKRVQKQLEGCTSPPLTAPPTGVDLPAVSNYTCPVDTYIAKDIILGKQIPVTLTPTFVIYYKGQKYPASSGSVSWQVFKNFFDQLLSQ
jgi:protein-disulfide isomerase